MYLLDTNVISELMKTSPNAGLEDWLRTVAFYDLYLSTITIAEISNGIEKLNYGKKQDKLRQSLAEIKSGFAERILDFDYHSALQFGIVNNRARKLGLSIYPFDALLLATAERYKLGLITRNIKHFENRTEIFLHNPFE